MTDKELVDAIEGIKEDTYKIVNRQVNKIKSDYKQRLKAIQDERSKRGQTKSMSVNYGCSDCVLAEININFLPYLESNRYNEFKAAVVPSNQVQLKMVPDVNNEELTNQPVEKGVRKAGRKKK